MSYRNLRMWDLLTDVNRMAHGQNPIRGTGDSEREMEWTLHGYTMRSLKLYRTYEENGLWWAVCARCGGHGVLDETVHSYAVSDRFSESGEKNCFACKDHNGVIRKKFRIPSPKTYKCFLYRWLDEKWAEGSFEEIRRVASSEI